MYHTEQTLALRAHLVIGTLSYKEALNTEQVRKDITYNMTTYFAASPLEQFETYSFISLNGLGFTLSLTNLGFYVVLAVVVLVSLHLLSINAHRVVPSR